MWYFDTNKSAIIITDVQIDYCHPDGKFARPNENGGFGIDISNLNEIAYKVWNFVERWKSQATVILLQNEEIKPQLAIRWTRWHEFHPAINPEGCKVIQKVDRNWFTVSLWEKSELQSFLEQHNKTDLLHGWFLLSRCVYATLCGWNQLGYSSTLIEDLTGNPPPKQNEADMVMRILMWHWETQLIKSDDISFK